LLTLAACEHAATRRWASGLARRLLGLGLLMALIVFFAPARAAGTLRVLAWPGYAEAEVLREFEQRSGAKVELTIVGSDEALWHRINARGGADFDVFAVNTAELQRYIQAGLVQSVDVGLIANTRKQLPRFRDLAAIPGLVHRRDGRAQTFAIPYTYAEMGLIYDKRQLPVPPSSISALWDPRLRGKVLAYDGGTHNFSLAAQALGSGSPFRLASAQWPRAVDKLIELRRNVLGFYSQPEESVRLFQRHGAALMHANYGMQQVQLLKAAGMDIGYVMPREGALAWLDCWAITRGARDRKLAHVWIDTLLAAKASELLVTRQGLANTTSETLPRQPEQAPLWLEPVEDAARREALWQRIRSGDRAAKVLAP